MANSMVNINFDNLLLASIKDFMEDLSCVMDDNENFKMYYSIVQRIDENKVKSYSKLVSGFRVFFKDNESMLTESNFTGLNNPMIAYTSVSDEKTTTFAFNFEKAFEVLHESEQEVVKDHLNQIWFHLNNENKGPEERYIEKIFKDLKDKFSPDLTKEQQMVIAKELFGDFQRQNLDIGIVVKITCQKARELLISSGSQTNTNTLLLIDAVEEIDIANFNIVQFFDLVGRVGTLFSEGENNPLQSLLSGVFSEGAIGPQLLCLKED